MRSLSSRSTSPLDAIRTVILQWWLSSKNLVTLAGSLAEKAGTHAFTNFTPGELGSVLIAQTDLWSHFAGVVAGDPAASYAWSTGLGSQQWFNAAMAQELGAALIKTEWWMKHLPEIEANKIALKKVRRVMES